jgi:hypothetical protein
MYVRDIVTALDAEIDRLQSARSLLVGSTSGRHRSRPTRIRIRWQSEKENHVRRWKEENRRGTAPALGEAESCEDEIGLPFRETRQ